MPDESTFTMPTDSRNSDSRSAKFNLADYFVISATPGADLTNTYTTATIPDPEFTAKCNAELAKCATISQSPPRTNAASRVISKTEFGDSYSTGFELPRVGGADFRVPSLSAILQNHLSLPDSSAMYQADFDLSNFPPLPAPATIYSPDSNDYYIATPPTTPASNSTGNEPGTGTETSTRPFGLTNYEVSIRLSTLEEKRYILTQETGPEVRQKLKKLFSYTVQTRKAHQLSTGHMKRNIKTLQTLLKRHVRKLKELEEVLTEIQSLLSGYYCEEAAGILLAARRMAELPDGIEYTAQQADLTETFNNSTSTRHSAGGAGGASLDSVVLSLHSTLNEMRNLTKNMTTARQRSEHFGGESSQAS